MEGGGGLKTFLGLMVVSFAVGEKWEVGAAQVHHIIGGDDGWHPESDIRSWSSTRTFRVGDKLWFSYRPAQESVVELQSMEEYLSCDLNNPIRMLTDGWSGVRFEEELFCKWVPRELQEWSEAALEGAA